MSKFSDNYVTVVLDSQAGSCGKGKFIGYLSREDNIGIAMNNFMSNAGHTFVYNDGTSVMTQHLPTSIVNKDTKLIIGPGSAITPSILFDEILKYKDIIADRSIIVHPRAMVINNIHCEKEKEIIRSGSTFKGCGVAQAEKVMRVPGTKLFGEFFNSHYLENYSHDEVKTIYETICVMDTMDFINNEIDMGTSVIIEGSQGCDLDINYGLEYPHTTSRQCHAGQLVADCGISPLLINEIIMIMRPYPIRISNETNIGLEISSGDYAGSEEITWDIVRDRCGAPKNIQFGEMTTVTKKMRRVFELNLERLQYVTRLNRPTQIGLNFAQYIDYDMIGRKGRGREDLLTNKVRKFIDMVEELTNTPVTLIGTGPKDCDMIDLRGQKLYCYERGNRR